VSAALAGVVPSLGWALLDFLWQGAAIGAAAALVLYALRDARPQARYAVACIALLACALLPLASVWNGLAPAGAPTVASFAEQAVASPAPLPALFVAADWRSAWGDRLAWIVALWSLGAGLFALRMLAGVAWVGDIRARALPVDAAWQARIDRLAEAIGLRVRVPLATAPRLDGPVVAGWWRPVVLLPAALLTRLPADMVEALLAHELAHIRRHDYLVNLLQGAIEALLFYHPVVWWLSRRIRIERELVADDLALRAIGDPRRLALALQQLDLYQAAHAAVPPTYPSLTRLVPAAHGGKLMSRIHRLVRPRLQAIDWRLLIPVAGLALACAAVYARAPVASVAPAAPVAAVAPISAVAPMAATPAATPAAAPLAAVATVAASRAAPSPAPAARPQRIPYAMVREGEDGMMLSGDMDDHADIKRTRQHVHGDFLWFRRDGAAYVVQDAAVLARARTAWAPAEAMGKKMEAIGEQMAPHGKRMEAIGKQMEAVSARLAPMNKDIERASRGMEPLAERQRALGEQMRVIGERMAEARGDTEREALSARMQALQAQMEPLSEEMREIGEVMRAHGDRLRDAHAPLERLGEEMRLASAPMEGLGEKMRVLGEQQEKLVHTADAELQGLIEQSLRDGKAVRADAIR
jgi:beta-lactamase regulating signal transducer with metallopeptidase domain/predicted  nucleic acid-binding Zn-ribbon protein